MRLSLLRTIAFSALATLAASDGIAGASAGAAGAPPFDVASLKPGWRARIDRIRARGFLPIIDIESSFNHRLNLEQLVRAMDEHGIALIAYSRDPRGMRWSDSAAQVLQADATRFIPTSNGANYPFWTNNPAGFLAETQHHVLADRYPLMGEFEFRHYLSVRQYRRGATHRDVNIPIDGEVGRALFAFAEKTGIAFQLHYEIDDALLPALERMLTRYSRAKVIWCHLAQVRYASRASTYGPAYVRKLIESHPNLYFDVAFGGPNSVYPGSGEYHARVWAGKRGRITREWRDLIEQNPWRFLAALDLAGDRQDEFPELVRNLRRFLDNFPDAVREIVGYKAAWRLLFGEDL